ncbi:MAG: Rrf2 family transcriptional regulator [Bacteroidota bacterium]|nr:Rrf2 family transcriptional regulator [Bacteroidota bacterium]MDP2112442.1 Rrf2 family transcriptional regulator [Bacteroidota bacterium]
MLSKAAEYAIRSMVYIWMMNQKGTRPGYRTIAIEVGSPEHFTAKVLQTMTRFNLVKAGKGRGGGFYFENPEKELPVFEIIKAIDGNKFFSSCAFGFENCSCANPCPMHDEFMIIRNNYTEMVQKVTVQSMAEKIINGTASLNQKLIVGN